MGWPEILSILEGELDKLADRPERLKSLKDWKDGEQFPTREAAINAMKFDESANQRTLDRACIEFAEGRTWPTLTREQMYWLYARLYAARVLVKFAADSKRTKGYVFPHPEEAVSENSILEHVLVRYWHFLGKHEFLGSLIFAPMGPFDPLADLPEPEI
jgi:hypothetical protein